MEWKRASNPWKAVNFGGTDSMKSGSTMDRTGKVVLLPPLIFSLVASLVTTVQASTSVPVPAVVGMATMGRGLFFIFWPPPVPP